MTPVVENGGIEYFLFDSNSPERKFAAELILKIRDLKTEASDAYEMEIISCLHSLWSRLYRQCRTRLQQSASSDDSDLTLQRKMVSYIYEHYQETVTLDEIAASGNMSRSKCCAILNDIYNSPLSIS